ncbi:MAG: transcriptional repressor LexA [Rhodospirillales bacterium]|jgi:repressor LexA|nr:transcriptional repressor LexA [Rhodospirillales bacterium]MBT4005999.1 transcriptional repressor LexA [Rhodospirillales bacterium]MBT5075260.1 transcriptional repressor LexA [Rhodospirillales bacterium]MBT5112742.1 transcriptional repressor LexA [Rhodospirillales bacterium]MBT5673512.1 transcriptional repressor LexA [Rhodospirillales bacterium]
MLTKKQHELLIFINARLQQTGICPSFDEMKDALALKSKSGIHRLISGLEERGFIRRLAHRARALEILRLPEGAAMGSATDGNDDGDNDQDFDPNVIKGNFKSNPKPANRLDGGETVELPLHGRIAAGTPIEALRDPTNSIGVPADMVGRGDHYALEVEGDSMIEAGILDGDIAVIRQSDTANNGAIVVALVEGHEVTLKRLRRKGPSIALEPANAAYETRIFGPDQVAVQGTLVGIIRTYH